MIYLPNKFERYLASLRNYLQNRSLKYGITPHILENMRKIYTAEALLCGDFIEPVDIGKLSSQILSAVYIKSIEKNLPFEFKIDCKGNVLINKKLYTALLLNLCKKAEKITLISLNGQILIKARNANKKTAFSLSKALGGIIFFERKLKSFIIILSPTATDKKAENNIYFDLNNPFCEVNYFIY